MDDISEAYKQILSLPLDQIMRVGRDVAIPIIPRPHVRELCQLAIGQLEALPRYVVIHGPLIVVGDLHGNLHDLLRIFGMFGTPETTKYLFLGDYVDRGNFSIETITLLLYFQVLYPRNVSLLRGNHEFPDINMQYGFRCEVEQTYGDADLWTEYNIVFGYMPIGALVNEQTFCIHGGIASGFCSLAQIANLPCPMTEENTPSLIKKLLWSDPSLDVSFFGENERGYGQEFGVYAIKQFCENLSLKRIIRAHQCVNKGCSCFCNICVTVFSSSGYSNHNSGAVLEISKDDAVIVQSYHPIPVQPRSISLFQSVITKKLSSRSPINISTMKPIRTSSLPINVLNSNHQHIPVYKNFKPILKKRPVIQCISGAQGYYGH